MLVVMSADMEAISQLLSPREILACCPEYWETGRQRMTDDVVAAATGLLEAGADEVVVLDNHGSGYPENLIGEDLPEGARLESWEIFDIAEHGAEALMLVGYHGRAGIASFVPHTYVPELRLRVDGRAIGESEGRAWAAGVPLIGLTGHGAEARRLSAVWDTPFLVVQESERVDAAVPVFDDPAEGLDAIRAFAAACLRSLPDSTHVPSSPKAPLFEAALDEPLADGAVEVMLAAGWEQTAAGTFAVRLPAWSEALPLLRAAMGAAAIPMAQTLQGVDLSSREALDAQNPSRVSALLHYVEMWLDAQVAQPRADWPAAT